jgi:hypothetical protein
MGGINTLTVFIKKKRPGEFRLNTINSTIGIRGTNFTARLCEEEGSGNQCGNSCAIEEQQFSAYQRLAATDTDHSGDSTQSECNTVGEITGGLYVGLYEGKINVAGNNGSLDLEAIGAARISGGKSECLTEVPNFLTLDPYLSNNPEYTVAQFTRDTGAENLFSRIDRLLKDGYSANVIYNDEVAKGNTIYSIVNAAVLSDPDRETEFRWLADLMLPGMPETACECSSFERDRDWVEIPYEALEPKTIEEVGRVFFEEDQQLARLNVNSTHGQFPVKELAQLMNEQSLWYRVLPVRNHPVPNAVFVSLYFDEQEVVVDGNLGLVQDAIDRGDEQIPVIFHYYQEGTMPVGRYPEQLTSDDAKEIFRNHDIEVSPVPNWKAGDYHAMMAIEQIENLVSLPEKDDIAPELWAAIEADIKANGFSFPVVLTSSSGAGGIKLYDSEERVVVARELGWQGVPLVIIEPPENPIRMSQCRRLVRGAVDEPIFFRSRYAGVPGNPGGPSIPATPDEPASDEIPIVPPPPPVSP